MTADDTPLVDADAAKPDDAADSDTKPSIRQSAKSRGKGKMTVISSDEEEDANESDSDYLPEANKRRKLNDGRSTQAADESDTALSDGWTIMQGAAAIGHGKHEDHDAENDEQEALKDMAGSRRLKILAQQVLNLQKAKACEHITPEDRDLGEGF